MVASLNDFNEERRSVLHWLRKNLQQVAILIKIDQDFMFLKNEISF